MKEVIEHSSHNPPFQKSSTNSNLLARVTIIYISIKIQIIIRINNKVEYNKL